jgi:hypothetical protein
MNEAALARVGLFRQEQRELPDLTLYVLMGIFHTGRTNIKTVYILPTQCV